ncbi:MAG TPA: ABC transporter permease, partial [Casimicrobiaceae bacterium]|nr:ABC transporter permease [Casimicrobiaceae bacterium]
MLKLALRNLVRQRGRTLITLAAIVFGVAGLIVSGGFISDLLDQLGEAVIHSQTGHLQIARRGFRDEGARRPERYSIAEPDRLTARLRSLPEVDDAMGRLDFSAVLNNGRTDLAIVGEGIEPDREARLGHSMRLTAGRRLTAADAHGAMIGQGLAHALRLAPGDRATLVTSTGAGAVNTADVEVVGVFQTFSKDYDARAIKVPLAVAQQLLDTEGASTLVVALKRTEDTQRAGAALKVMLKDDYEIATWQELNDFHSKTVTLYERQFGVLQLIILLTVMLSVANSVNMSVSER